MLPTTDFIIKISGMIGNALHALRGISKEHREQQAVYLDHISNTLAEAVVAMNENQSILSQLSELEFLLEKIEDVLRWGDPNFVMSVSDETVLNLKEQLKTAIENSDFNILKSGIKKDEELKEMIRTKNAFLKASGMFRAAAIFVRSSSRI